MKPPLQEALKLYLVTDPVLHGGRGVIPTCRLALEAGVRFLQLRDKEASTWNMCSIALELKKLCDEYSAWFVVNDRIDVALSSGAHGVHLGQDDMPASSARKILGPEAVIGVSARTVEEAAAAAEAGADYIAANLVFPTDTKKGLGEPLGLEMVRRLSEASSLPLVAIGGIKPGNAKEVMVAGCSGVAVVTAIMNAPDPAEEVRSFLKVLSR
mgnify:CR=1 FL=1